MESGVLFSTVALICYVSAMLITIRQARAKRTARPFMLYLAALSFWQFAALMVSISTNAASALLWYRVMTAGLGGQFVFYSLFILVFVGQGNQRLFSHAGWLMFLALLASSGTGLIIKDVSESSATGLFVPSFGPLVPIVGLISYGFLGYGACILVRHYRSATFHLHRNRIKYLLLGLGVIAGGTLSNILPALQAYPIDRAANAINAFLIAYAILRYQLLDITVVVRKGLLYSIPTGIIGATYFFAIFLATKLFDALAGPQIFALSLIVAVIAALITQPLRSRAQDWIDRLFFQEKYDAGLMLRRLSSATTSILEIDKLTTLILDEVTTTMHIERAAFFLRQKYGSGFRLTAYQGLGPIPGMSLRSDHPVVGWLRSHTDALSKHKVEMSPQFKSLWGQEKRDMETLGAELFIPLNVKGELAAIFTVGPKLSTETFSHDDQMTLITLANQTAVAIENARLYSELEGALQALRKANDELEMRVQERTTELAQTNQALEAEVAERTRAEKELQRYSNELERSNQELAQFAYVASHDLQEPLRMVTSYVQLLEQRYQGKLDADADEFIAFAVDGATRMQALIKGLLAYSRVGTHGKPFVAVDSQAILEQTLLDLQVAIQESGATVTYDSLPTLVADGTQLGQVFQNLVGNALKFHRDRRPEVHVSAEQQNGEWVFSVRDNGIGIEPQYYERIFAIFQRLHTRDEYPGTGIGLAVCKRIVERHGGRIWLESKPGEGSIFYFAIPSDLTGSCSPLGQSACTQ